MDTVDTADAMASARVRIAATVQVTGEVRGRTASAVVAAIEQVAGGLSTGSVLVMDLRELTLLVAAGLRPLVEAAERCTARGVRCCVVAQPGGVVAAALDSTNARAVLGWFDNIEQALAATTSETASGTASATASGVDVGADVGAAAGTEPGGAASSDPGGDSEVEPLSAHFAMLTRALLGTSTVGAALRHVIDAATVAIPAAAAASVTLRSPDGRVLTPVQTAGVAGELDRVQYDTGQGPCLAAAQPHGPAYAASQDLRTEQRWPQFSAAATAAGYRAVHATEVLPGAGSDRPTGALNLYFRDPHTLDENQRHAALLLATHAALAVAHAHSTELADLNNSGLRHAIDTRDVIGQAKGILMHREGISADDAFNVLRRTSQDLNIKLVELARTLAATPAELDGGLAGQG